MSNSFSGDTDLDTGPISKIEDTSVDSPEVRLLVKNYLVCREKLKALGVLRSERNLEGDYAEWIVAARLGLQLVSNTVQKGIDAVDRQGGTYQIKSRRVASNTSSTAFAFSGLDSKFDWLVCVFFSNHTLDLLGMLRVPYEAVRELSVRNGPADFRFRWNRKVADDRRIERMFWKEGAVRP